jgi:RNA polymerase sigma-70 factor, ECF subfamily
MGWRDASGTEGQQFDALFGAYYSELRRFVLRRIENREAGEDILAETFAVAWRRRERIPDPALPWLFGVCHKLIANHRRSARRRLRLINRMAASTPDLGRDPAELLAERSEIGVAFARLSSAQREVLMLVAWDGLSATDAATVLGCTPAAFRVRLHRARNELAKHLSDAGHESGGIADTGGPRQGFQESG